MQTTFSLKDTAAELVATYGDDALVEAQERMELMRAIQSLEGLRVWREITSHVEKLMVKQTREGAA